MTETTGITGNPRAGIVYGVSYLNLDTLYFADRAEAAAFAAEFSEEVFDVDPKYLGADDEVFS